MKKILLLTIMCVFALFGNVKAQETIEIGGSSHLAWCAPLVDYFCHSVCQQIYTAEELQGKTGSINSITFKHGKGAPNTRNIVVYMKNIDKESFESGDFSNDWIAISDEDIVYEGEWTLIGATTGDVIPMTIYLQKNFEYTGGDMLLCMHDKTGVGITNKDDYNYFYCYPNENNRTLYYYTDNSNGLDMNNLSSYNGMTMYLANYLKLTFEGSPKVTIAASAYDIYSDQTATLTATAANFDSDVTYSWSSNGEIVGNESTYTFTPTATGTYTFTCTATDANNNEASASVTINVTERPALQLAVSADKNLIYNDDETAVLTATVTDGTGYAPYTYSWTLDGEEVGTEATYTFDPSAAGIYTFTCTATDANNNEASASVTINVTERPALQLAVSADKNLIYNDDETAVLTATVTDGTGYAPYTYSWTLDGEEVGTEATYSFSNTTVGVYTLTCTVTDVRGNTQTASTTIEVKDVNEKPLEIVIGSNGTTETHSMLPLYTYYNRSITQQIYTADELGGNELNITSISFEVVSAAEDDRTRGVEIYLMNTSKESFASQTDMVNLSDNDKYYTGSLQFNNTGWMELTLTEPFEYTGDNLLICVVNENDNYYSAPSFRVYKTGTETNRSLIYYKDNVPKFDHTNVNDNAQYATAHYGDYNNNVIKLGYELPVPKPQNLAIVEGEKTKLYPGETTKISWNALDGAAGYNVYVNNVKFNTEAVEGLSYELANLPYGMNTIAVAAVFADDSESGMSNTVTVQMAGTFPLTIKVQDMNGNAVAGAEIFIEGTDEYGNNVKFEGVVSYAEKS